MENLMGVLSCVKVNDLLGDMNTGQHTLWHITSKELIILLFGSKELYHVLNFLYFRMLCFHLLLYKTLVFPIKKKKKKKVVFFCFHFQFSIGPTIKKLSWIKYLNSIFIFSILKSWIWIQKMKSHFSVFLIL